MTAALKTPTFYISDDAPLAWLVSLLFTHEYRDLLRITQSSLNPAATRDNLEDAFIPAAFKSFDDVYQAATEFVTKHKDAKKCYAKALAAIEKGDLAYIEREVDEWGEKVGYKRDDAVGSFEFLRWAEHQGYKLDAEIVAAARGAVMSYQHRKDDAEKQVRLFPPITPDNFSQLRKEPLWRVADAILYVMGHRSRSKGKEAEFAGCKDGFKRMLQYVVDADKAGRLEVVDYDRSFVNEEKRKPFDTLMMEARVKPDEFIAWAKTLPADLPMLAEQQEAPTAATRPSYSTPDMMLMYDAVQKFWGEYDLTKPNPNVAPKKQDVVQWLIAEAQRRGIEFSKTRAEYMDTIMRCPAAQKGGNTF